MQIDFQIFLLSLLFDLSSLLIVTVIYFIVRLLKKDSFIEKLFLRFLLAYAVFNVFYIFIPAIINVINPPENKYLFTTVLVDLNSSGTLTVGYWESTLNSIFRYWLQMIVTSSFTFLFFPFALLPVIFVFGAFLSFLLVLYQLKKSNPKESLASSLAQIQFGYDDNPFSLMSEKLKKPNWANAWDLFKILIAVLPISLYLLMTLLKVTGNQENPNILQGTSLGWFLEIFFVYLASLMFSVHLLYSGKFSFKGDFMGLKLRNAMIQSLSTVGTLMSAIAIILFVIDYSRQFFIVIYFISYFIMVTIFFVLFLDIFEPFSIYLVTKFIEYSKRYSSVTITQDEGELAPKGLKTAQQPEIFVPSVNLNELENPEVTSVPSEKADFKSENEEKAEIVHEETVFEKQKTLNQLLLKDTGSITLKTAFTILLLFVFMRMFQVLVGIVQPNLISNTSAQTIIFSVVFIYLCIPLLIVLYLFARKHVKVALIAIAFHIIIVMADWAIREIIIRWNGPEKFATLNYQTSYYLFQFDMIVVLLAVSLLLMRKYNWNFLSNVGLIFITGLIMVVTWIFIFTDKFNLIIPFTQQSILAGQVLVVPENLSSPIPTFNSLVVALLQSGESWVTFIFQDVTIQSTGIKLVIPFLSNVPVNFVPILEISSLPFRFLQYISTILLYGLIVFLAKPEFLTVKFEDDSTVEKIVYSERLTPLTLAEIAKTPNDFAISRNFGLGDENEVKGGFTVTQIEESIYQLGIGAHIIQYIQEAPITFQDLQEESLLSIEEILDFFDEISKIQLSKAKPFLIFNREFGFTYEEANLDSLHVMMVDGRSVFTHNFKDESTVEPALVAGLFSAITSFAKETVKSEQLLRTIDHGDVVLMIEYGQYVFSAIFADKNSVELRTKLATFVKEFEDRHEQDLDGWLGDTSPFADDWMLVNEIFELD